MLRNYIRPDADLMPDQIQGLLNHFITKLIDKMEKEGTITAGEAHDLRKDENKQKLIELVYDAIKKEGQTFQLRDLDDPENKLVQKILIASVTAIVLQKNMGLDKLDKLQKDIKEKNVLTPKELEKIRSSQEILSLKQQLLQSKEEIEKEFNFLPQPKPQPQKDKTEIKSDKEEVDSVTTNWLGLLSRSTGGLAATVSCVIGNYYGLNDWNPNHGYAPVDAQNKTDDNAFGDPLGLNASAIGNYLSAAAFGSDLVNEMTNALVVQPSPTLQPFNGGGT